MQVLKYLNYIYSLNCKMHDFDVAVSVKTPKGYGIIDAYKVAIHLAPRSPARVYI